MIDETTRRRHRRLHDEQKMSREGREPSTESFGRRRRHHHHHHHRHQCELANAGSDFDGDDAVSHCGDNEQNVNGDAESGYGGAREEAALIREEKKFTWTKDLVMKVYK